MNELEYEKFFSFNKESRKYKIELTKVIKFLLSKQRVIEAKYHFIELEKVNPNHVVVMALGFDIGVKTFDREMVVKYHDLLKACKKYNKHDLYIKMIIYWLSINRKDNASLDVKVLLDDVSLDNGRLIKLYNIIYHELNEENLIIKADDVFKKRNLRIIKGSV
ncbi:hypothetical protein [Pectobacterium versatile]|uniref:hypothetical protein n=1 Tax=Pectobacterium versatile TaxID=2488639 RepID=UPI001F43C938|nr:hypothetical protein [Pectobacterium versatile]